MENNDIDVAPGPDGTVYTVVDKSGKVRSFPFLTLAILFIITDEGRALA